LKHGGADLKGLDDIAHLASSGRTSIPVDETVPKALYRATGYRVSGPRAIRVDILERLADIIRPAVAFRPGLTPGEPPPGAFLGDGFTVTGSMTSLAGCAGEDFAAVLKGLGYRMEKRPPMKDVPIIPIVVAAAAPLAAPAGPDLAATSAEEPVAEAAPSVEAIADESPAGPVLVEATPGEEDVGTEVVSVEAAVSPEAVEAATSIEASLDPEPAIPTEPSDAPAVASPEAATAAKAQLAAVEPELVEVWRPARHDRHPRGNRDAQRGPRRDRRPAPAVASGEAAPTAQPGEPRPQRDNQRWQKRDRPDGQMPRSVEGRPEHRREDRPKGGNRGDQRQRDGNRPPRDDRRPPRDENSGPRRDRDKPRFGEQRSQSYQDPKPRDKQPDPNSPFAQLAALKAQLEAKK
jgi:ATP-dependent RNA helicase SUPV3L1/SUV3